MLVHERLPFSPALQAVVWTDANEKQSRWQVGFYSVASLHTAGDCPPDLDLLALYTRASARKPASARRISFTQNVPLVCPYIIPPGAPLSAPHPARPRAARRGGCIPRQAGHIFS